MLKQIKTLDRFKRVKNLYTSQAIIGENGGNDSWKVNIRVWREPHEKTWRYRYECKGELLNPKKEVAYAPKCGEGEGYESAGTARTALKEALEKDYA